MAVIDLVWLSDNHPAPPEWGTGKLHIVRPTPQAVAALLQSALPGSPADAWLFWDATLGIPDQQLIQTAFNRPGDVWHSGLRMGLASQPGILDFIDPTWMLNADPAPDKECTSWRLSLRCCLARAAVLRSLGGPHPAFRSLEAASLELGLRWVHNGVFTRHLPWLLPENYLSNALQLQFEDELRIALHRKGRRWTFWALQRACISGYAPPRAVFNAARTVLREALPSPVIPFAHPETSAAVEPAARVTVLIPTVDRYPYLRALLDQLRAQTIPPLEIIIVDQTAQDRRDQSLQQDFPDLPIRILYLDKPGQCTSRNAGLQQSRGNFVLFIDDDVEIEPDLIEKHLATIRLFQCDASSGIALEPKPGVLSPEFQRTRSSDVFPTNNSMISRAILERSGLFDPHFDQGPRADHDLGTRIYLCGGKMVLNHQIRLVHHHAPSGGLRTHKARVVTRASSRASLAQRHIPAATEIYLALRYFTARQVREMLLLRVIGTLVGEGSAFRKMLKFFAGVILLPDTLLKTRANLRKARTMISQGTMIPFLDPKIQTVEEEDRAPAAAQR